MCILTAAVSSKILRKFQLPSQQTTTLANPAKVVVAIPSGKRSFERNQFLRNLECLRGPPVTVVNDIDDTSPPLTFNFVNESIMGKDVEKADEGFMSGCDCRVENGRQCGCEYRKCQCLQQSDRDAAGNVHFPYTASNRNKGCLRQVYLDSRNHIYECNSKCNCQANCKNKLVQNGRKVPLEIFKTTNRGWGKFGEFWFYPSWG
jgi:histone-lysine N-methyltransferase SUV39H